MDYTPYTTVKNRLQRSPNLCDLFKLLSIETWKRLEYAYIKPRVKVFETTLTQNLIFTLNAYSDQFGLDIDVLEALDENTNGNDFELIIRFPAEGIEYYAPIQAKKVYRNEKYTSMDHGNQIESLINYAALNNARPLYLLYNYARYAGATSTYTPPELTGCTLISAHYLFENYYQKRIGYRDGVIGDKWIIPNIYELNPTPAFGWHELVCSATPIDLFDNLKVKGIIPKTAESSEIVSNNTPLQTGFYPINTFKSDGWVGLKDLLPDYESEQTKSIEAEYPRQVIYEDIGSDNFNRPKRRATIYPPFSPKSRIIINKE